MAVGKKCWYVLSLWEKAIRVTVVRTETDWLGRVCWVEAVDSKGNMYRDYIVRFTTSRPVQYYSC